MSTIPQSLQTAVRHHQAGRLAEAEQIYRKILQAEPQHAQAMHLLGVVALQSGRSESAIELISAAITLDAQQAVFHTNLGEAYRACGKLEQAKTCYQQAIHLQPRLAQPHFNLALTHHALGQTEAARQCAELAISLKPDYSEAHNLLGNVLRAQTDRVGAEACYERALLCNPNNGEALLNQVSLLVEQAEFDRAANYLERALSLRPHSSELHRHFGNLKVSQQDWPAAITWYEQSLRLDPNSAETEFRLGIALRSQGEVNAAIPHFQRAAQLQPNHAGAHFSLAISLESAGLIDEAFAAYEQALRVDPTYLQAILNLAAILQQRGQYQEVLTYYDQALRLAPNDAAVRFNRSLVLLKLGDFERGWVDYESRLNLPGFRIQSRSQPLWDGSDLGDRRLLVYEEQGFGDTLQFIRYLRLFEARGIQPIVLVQPQLVPLLKQSGFTGLVAGGERLPPFDCQIPLMSLPRFFGTTLANIPAEVPYVHPSPQLVDSWRERLQKIDGFKVGIHWQGKPTYIGDTHRSIPLLAFEPLARVANVRLISLQKNIGREQLGQLDGRFSVVDLGDEVDQTGNAFMDTAAIMKNLDLVITSDTATTHLAGALGVPVWVALAARSDWRFLADRDDNPWYPTMQLFRQTRQGDWPSVFERMAAELQRRSQSRGRTAAP